MPLSLERFLIDCASDTRDAHIGASVGLMMSLEVQAQPVEGDHSDDSCHEDQGENCGVSSEPNVGERAGRKGIEIILKE